MIRYQPYGRQTGATLHFGKHAGKPLAEVPPTYLLWCLSSTDRLTPGLRAAVRDQALENGFPFGKHKQTPLSQVPLDYLTWALNNMELRDDLKGLIQFELDRRNGTFTEDR